jgi:hypothetical protein
VGPYPEEETMSVTVRWLEHWDQPTGRRQGEEVRVPSTAKEKKENRDLKLCFPSSFHERPIAISPIALSAAIVFVITTKFLLPHFWMTRFPSRRVSLLLALCAGALRGCVVMDIACEGFVRDARVHVVGIVDIVGVVLKVFHRAIISREL